MRASQPSPFRAMLMLALAVSALAAMVPMTAAADTLAGRWRIDNPLTREEQPAERGPGTTSGLPRPTVSVGGMPVPVPGGSAYPGMGGSAPDPMVLRATDVTVTPAGDELRLDFDGIGSETLRRGRHQGMTSRWTERKLTTGYATTSRKVSQTWEVRRDGTLLVTVKLNPNQGRTLTHKRVFRRVPE